MKIRVIFVTVHLFLITGMIVYWAYTLYPEEAGHLDYRSRALAEIYDELILYEKEMGVYPQNIDTLLHYDENEDQVFFRSKALEYFYHLPGDIKKIRYRLKDKEPVISYLGGDGKEGGLGLDMDVVYPRKYQNPFKFLDFKDTKQFRSSFIFGFLFALATSICLYHIWKKRSTFTSGSKESYCYNVFLSILFLAFELFLTQCIVFGHVYPHH